MQIDLTQIILAVLTFIFGILMRYVIPAIKNKTDSNQRELIQIAIKTAVYAAEMLYKSDQGQQKRQYVIDLLAKQGYILDPDKVEDTMLAQIEAMVKELKIEQAQVK